MKVVIDGNIGSGKTTQLNLLEQKRWTVQREPIDNWPLELFYKDKSRWALLLQMKILQTLQPVETKDVIIYERCLLSTRYVFWEHLLQKKLVRPEENDVYCYQYDKDTWFPDLYIFLLILCKITRPPKLRRYKTSRCETTSTMPSKQIRTLKTQWRRSDLLHNLALESPQPKGSNKRL
jgi:hypothetical protein